MSIDLTEIDPFTRVLAAIWTYLELSERFTAAVPVANRVKGVDRLPGHAPADLAKGAGKGGRVGVVPSPGGAIDLFQTSSASRIIQNYTIAMATRKDTPEAALFPLKWIVIAAMKKAVEEKLGLPDLVTKVRFIDSNEGVSDTDRAAGWEGVLVVSVEMRMETNQLT